MIPAVLLDEMPATDKYPAGYLMRIVTSNKVYNLVFRDKSEIVALSERIRDSCVE